MISLYQATGWRAQPNRVNAVLGSSPAVGAWYEDKLVGFARAVTEGIPRAYVEAVVVCPDMRVTGIGHTHADPQVGVTAAHLEGH